MRFRIWALIVVVMVLAGTVGCASLRLSRAPVDTPVPTKTLRPTFTNTPAQTTLELPPATPQVAAVQIATAEPAVSAPPTAAPPTIAPPTAAPPTAEPPTLTVTNATVNVRSGPGTNYATMGQIRQGQSFAITGKNPAGDWWQFDYNGRTGWIIGRLVSARSTDGVQVAANIPAPPPTARPRPTVRPTVAPPTQPPAPTYRFATAGTEPRPSSNNLITVWCRVLNPSQTALLPGTLRVTRGGSALAEQSFLDIRNEGDPGLPSEFYYNQNCKVELPLAAGTYSAYLIAGGDQISDPIDLSVEGETRIFILTWVQK